MIVVDANNLDADHVSMSADSAIITPGTGEGTNELAITVPANSILQWRVDTIPVTNDTAHHYQALITAVTLYQGNGTAKNGDASKVLKGWEWTTRMSIM